MSSGTSLLRTPTTTPSSVVPSVWSALQELIQCLEDEKDNENRIKELLQVLLLEESIIAEITVAVQYWHGMAVALESDHSRLFWARTNGFDKAFEAVQTKVYANPVYYGGPEVAKDDDCQGI